MRSDSPIIERGTDPGECLLRVAERCFGSRKVVERERLGKAVVCARELKSSAFTEELQSPVMIAPL